MIWVHHFLAVCATRNGLASLSSFLMFITETVRVLSSCLCVCVRGIRMGLPDGTQDAQLNLISHKQQILV